MTVSRARCRTDFFPSKAAPKALEEEDGLNVDGHGGCFQLQLAHGSASTPRAGIGAGVASLCSNIPLGIDRENFPEKAKASAREEAPSAARAGQEARQASRALCPQQSQVARFFAREKDEAKLGQGQIGQANRRSGILVRPVFIRRANCTNASSTPAPSFALVFQDR